MGGLVGGEGRGCWLEVWGRDMRGRGGRIDGREGERRMRRSKYCDWGRK